MGPRSPDQNRVRSDWRFPVQKRVSVSSERSIRIVRWNRQHRCVPGLQLLVLMVHLVQLLLVDLTGVLLVQSGLEELLLRGVYLVLLVQFLFLIPDAILGLVVHLDLELWALLVLRVLTDLFHLGLMWLLLLVMLWLIRLGVLLLLVLVLCLDLLIFLLVHLSVELLLFLALDLVVDLVLDVLPVSPLEDWFQI